MTRVCSRDMPREVLVRSYLVGLASSWLEAQGHDPSPLLARLSIPEQARTEQNLVLPRASLVALFDEAERLSGDNVAGVHIGWTLHPRPTLLDYLLLHSPSPRVYFANVVRFALLGTGTLTWSCVDEGELLCFGCEVAGDPGCLGRHPSECLLARTVAFLRMMTGSLSSVVRAELPHAAHRRRAFVEAELATEVAFGAGRVAVYFPRALLDVASTLADPGLHRVLLEYAERELAPLDTSRPLVARVRQRIHEEMHDHLPTLESVAEGLGTTSRWLQRQLAEHDTSFAELLDGVRESVARQALADTTAGLWDIAVRLHYSDLSAFGRAFRRWTGTTPGRFRDGVAA